MGVNGSNAVATMPTSAVDPVVADAMAMSARLGPLKNALGIADLTDQEMGLFAMVALRMELDPFQRQIYAIKRQGKVTFQTGIDGFRSSAERTGEYRGSDEPEFGPIVERPFPHPEWARVVVHRQLPDGEWIHQSATAWWDEFYPGESQGHMWRKMPRNQLAKCAEAAGLRKAFPKRFGQVYVTEEMQQAEAVEAATPVGPVTARERVAQLRARTEAPTTHGAGLHGAHAPAETVSTPAEAVATVDPSPVMHPAGEGDAVTEDGEVVEGEVVEGELVDGLSAGELRDWLRERLIGITEARSRARDLFGVDVLDRLTDGQRGALRSDLDARAAS